MAAEFVILVAEDDPNDAALLEKAIRKNGFEYPLRMVADGGEAICYLEGQGKYADRSQFPFPRVLITDLKMPRLNGLELLEWLRDHPKSYVLPTILLSGSSLLVDVVRAYRLGVNTYFQKPGSFGELVEIVRVAHEYWMRAVVPAIQDCPPV